MSSRAPWVLAAWAAWAISGLARAELPAQWESGGFHHQGFEVTTDSLERFQGKPALRIRSTPAIDAQGEANAATGFFAERYRGKRVRFSGYLKTADVARWSGLWLSVDGSPGYNDKLNGKAGERARRLRYDNMRNRPVKGSTPWTRYDIVVDVPAEASDITLGFFLVGPGTVWLGSPSFEEVGLDVPVTSTSSKNLPPEPQLDLNQK